MNGYSLFKKNNKKRSKVMKQPIYDMGDFSMDKAKEERTIVMTIISIIFERYCQYM